MIANTDIVVQLKDKEARLRLLSLLGSDADLPGEFPEILPDAAPAVVVTDDPFFRAPPGSALIYVSPDSATKPETLAREVRRAWMQFETRRSNLAAYESARDNASTLEEIAQGLAQRVRQLSRQNEMRIALLEQMPVGIVGVDDLGCVVLVNAEAHKVLAELPVSPFGMPADMIFPSEVVALLHDRSRSSANYEICGQRFLVKRSDMDIDGEHLGQILALIKID
ncbi:MAG: hypothetical protein RL095_2691 [Verrucomicrobiota bacterium]|jgi:PAS domain-containing protein